MNKALTINELKTFVDQQIESGNGHKRILISQDDEGNGFHELFFAFTPIDGFLNRSNMFPIYIDRKELENDYIILG